MRRRKFLIESSRAAGLIPLAGWLKASPFDYKSRTSTDSMIADLKKLIPRLMRETIVPGLSIALVEDGELRWQQGFGVRNARSKEPVTPDTVFEAASVSKTVFAYAVLKLCEKGVIKLDTPLSQYAPKPFVTGDLQLKLISARHVLSHTTGLQNIRTEDEPLKIHFKPGTQFLYSGEGYYYLQSVIAHLMGREDRTNCSQYEAGLKVCATDFDTFMKRGVLQPFGMKSSSYLWNDTLTKNLAHPHDITGKLLPKTRPIKPDVARYGSMGGLLTTCSDYAHFLLEVLAPKPSDTFRLTKTYHDEMLRPQIKLKADEKIDGADAWALGWAIQQRKTGAVILHSGGQSGFRSLTMGSVNRQSGFVVLTNGDNGGKVIFHPEFATVLNPLLIG
ncbi:beta-lactamase family protein [Spirosoma sp. BT702]|uniref:Beta-lactamase family protein n=1 Tax=Spirosoma profusum TaxID=2771354 RepID=A0A926XWS5_9BACT|nr:serine hydrolase domain-containing protein [Spirosoma profusum]MBD2701545.1 beta-lactamase family protein [Spirosoma profusum]